jgi:hypothetical protein
MKTGYKVLTALLAASVLLWAVTTLLTPSMDRWGATDAEVRAHFPGDELVPSPARFMNRAISIAATPEQIYPWLLQLGAGKGGLYSYTTVEKLIGCPLQNAERIEPSWQHLQVGDLVKMCPSEPAPPPYIVAQLIPNRALVMGHREHDRWVDLWQFVLVPQPEGGTRLILRTRTMMVGGMWDVIRPFVFVMERGLLRGVKERAERLASGRSGEHAHLRSVHTDPSVANVGA